MGIPHVKHIKKIINLEHIKKIINLVYFQKEFIPWIMHNHTVPSNCFLQYVDEKV